MGWPGPLERPVRFFARRPAAVLAGERVLRRHAHPAIRQDHARLARADGDAGRRQARFRAVSGAGAGRGDPARRDNAPDGGVCEVCPSALALADEIARIVALQGGGALIVDYGYDKPGFGETLQAVADHGFAGILDDPGESDLSAHVDFAALASAAARASVSGPNTQAEFLDDIGIVRRFEQLASHNAAMANELRSQLDRLVNPQQMGTLFKALAIMPRGAPTPPGF